MLETRQWHHLSAHATRCSSPQHIILQSDNVSYRLNQYISVISPSHQAFPFRGHDQNLPAWFHTLPWTTDAPWRRTLANQWHPIAEKPTKCFQSHGAWLNFIKGLICISFDDFVFLSRSGPFVSRLHPHAAGRIIHHIHQSSGVIAALGPRMWRWLLRFSGRTLKTDWLTGHFLLNADNRGWRSFSVRSLRHAFFANALENHLRFCGGFGALLSHIVT